MMVSTQNDRAGTAISWKGIPQYDERSDPNRGH